MKKSRRWLLLPLLALIAYFGFRSLGGHPEANRDEPPETLFNRIWLEKVPDKPTDYVHGAFVLGEQPFGAFQRASTFDFHVELFEYDRSGKQLKLSFPQTDKTAKVTFTITSCDEPPFDLCLTLSDNPWGGPKKYYGFKDSGDEQKRLPGAAQDLASRARAAAAASH
jgi:hypothetical protein